MTEPSLRDDIGSLAIYKSIGVKIIGVHRWKLVHERFDDELAAGDIVIFLKGPF